MAALWQFLLQAQLLSFCIFDLDRIALLLNQIPASKVLFSYTII